ncbi:MAG: S1 RNA-binding domain-containing protein [Planctomycetes bacterium]|nr:S1 RNA-binding domain-containing protein [Planctomycetota bacterium]
MYEGTAQVAGGYDPGVKRLQVGDKVTAPVVHVAPFGLFLDHEGQSILVRLPDLSYAPVRDPKAIAKPGDRVDVQIIGITDRQILASALPYVENPFADARRFGVGSTLPARVVEEAYTMWKRGSAWRPGDPVCDFPEYPHREHVGVIVEIEHDLRFVIPDAEIGARTVRVGDEVSVSVTAVDDHGRPTQVHLAPGEPEGGHDDPRTRR